MIVKSEGKGYVRDNTSVNITAEQRVILATVDPQRRQQFLSPLPYVGDDFSEQKEDGADVSRILKNMRLGPQER